VSGKTVQQEKNNLAFYHRRQPQWCGTEYWATFI